MAALDELIAFRIRHDLPDPLADVLSSPALRTDKARYAALYGYAQGRGLTEADGLNPAWLSGQPSP